MPEPKRHHTKSKVGRRRSHQALKKTNLQTCSNCNAATLPHRTCINCGEYVKGKKKK